MSVSSPKDLGFFERQATNLDKIVEEEIDECDSSGSSKGGGGDQHNQHNHQQPLITINNNNNTLQNLREKTSDSFKSTSGFSLTSESDDDYDDENRSLVEYQNVCFNLNIVPCKILLKSLPTSSIVLTNYGLNSTGILALTQALKVRDR